MKVERGFSFVAVEADWADAYRVNRWVRGASEEPGPEGGARRLHALSSLDASALHPLERRAYEEMDLPETFPSGM